MVEVFLLELFHLVYQVFDLLILMKNKQMFLSISKRKRKAYVFIDFDLEVGSLGPVDLP
jgi:hypothetical protein